MIMILPRQSRWRRLWWAHPELSLAVVAAAAWIAVLIVHIATGSSRAGAHHSSPVTTGSEAVPDFLFSVGLWIVMATAMMLPTALPAARSISLNGKWKRRQRGPALFAIGYVGTWSAVGAILLSAVWSAVRSIGPEATGTLAVSATLAVAAAWELTRWKRMCLRACHRSRSLPPDGWRADRACVREGIRNGMWCTGSCGPIMATMALVPHSAGLVSMLLLSAVVSAEKLLTRAVYHLRVGAVVLAFAAIVAASTAPVT